MRLRGTDSWQIHVDQWAELYDVPLWIRAAERIEAAGALVPGPLEIDPVPSPTTAPDPELAEGWVAWWEAVVRQQKPVFTGVGWPAQPDRAFAPPDFGGLDPWPALRDVVLRRWREAHDWHNARKIAGISLHLPPRPAINHVVTGVERSLRRPVKPFVLELILLPVRDDEIRRVHDARYLVPERVYNGPAWPDLLQPLVTRLGA